MCRWKAAHTDPPIRPYVQKGQLQTWSLRHSIQICTLGLFRRLWGVFHGALHGIMLQGPPLRLLLDYVVFMRLFRMIPLWASSLSISWWSACSYSARVAKCRSFCHTTGRKILLLCWRWQFWLRYLLCYRSLLIRGRLFCAITAYFSSSPFIVPFFRQLPWRSSALARFCASCILRLAACLALWANWSLSASVVPLFCRSLLYC